MELSEKNKAFWALPDNEKRVAVAKDVLAQIEAGKISPIEGTYFSTVGPRLKEIEPLDNVLRDKADVCSCCAIGACFFSIVNLGDEVTSKVIETREGCDEKNIYYISPRNMRLQLKKIFTNLQLALIESAFEVGIFSGGTDASDMDALYSAIRWGQLYDTDEERMIALMNNIIENKGELVFKRVTPEDNLENSLL